MSFYKRLLFTLIFTAVGAGAAYAEEDETQTERISVGAGSAGIYNKVNISSQDDIAHPDGAAAENRGTLIIGKNAAFTENEAVGTGGAVWNNNVVNIAEGATFTGNKADVSGGAVQNIVGSNSRGVITLGKTALFEGNTAVDPGSKGGAVFNQNSKFSAGEGATFWQNASASYGGAIYQQTQSSSSYDSELVFDRLALFDENISGAGGAIYSTNESGSKTASAIFGSETIFSLNKAEALDDGSLGYGGAVVNNKGSFQLGNYAVFVDNSADTYGGAFVSDGVTKFNGMVFFATNSAGTYGGAFTNTDAAGTGYNVDFTGAANFLSNTAGTFAGALYNRNDTVSFGAQALFSGNSAGTYGGAAVNKKTMNFAAGAAFSGNTAGEHGGALVNEGNIAFGGNAEFTGNTAGSYGGALVNSGTLTVAGTTLFSDNTAGEHGGAFVNSGNMTLSGNVNFTGNTSGGDGVVVNSGTLMFGKDVVFSGNSRSVGDIINGGTLIFANNANITLESGIVKDGTGSVIQFGQNTNLASARLTATPSITADIVIVGDNSTLSHLIVGDGITGNNIKLFEGSVSSSGKFVFDTLNYNNVLYWVSQNTDGTFNVSRKTTSEIIGATGADLNKANSVMAIMDGLSSNDQFNELFHNISDLMQSSDTADIEKGLNAAGALAPTAAPVVQAATNQNMRQLYNAVAMRLVGRVVPGYEGIPSGDAELGYVSVWTQALFNRTRLEGKTGFDSYSYGGAVGFELNSEEQLKAGLGYGYTYSILKPELRRTQVDSHTGLAYIQYKPYKWYINAMGSYTLGKYDETKYVTSVDVKSKYDVNSYAAQAMTGVDIDMFYYLVTPEIGVRYMNAERKASSDSAGTRTSAEEYDVLTGVFAITGKHVLTHNDFMDGIFVRPELRLAVTYDFENTDVSSFMTLPNGSSVRIEGDALERLGGEVGLSLTKNIGREWEFVLEYEGKFRKYYQDHTAVVSIKYNF